MQIDIHRMRGGVEDLFFYFEKQIGLTEACRNVPAVRPRAQLIVEIGYLESLYTDLLTIA